MDYEFLPKKGMPMGKKFNCSLGFFELPSEILEITIGSDGILFDCEDGQYFGRLLGEGTEEIHIKKINCSR